jgi:general stress protein 26
MGLSMRNFDDISDQDATRRWLAGAAKTVIDCRYCWLLSAAPGARVSVRPMGLVARKLDPEDWTLSFVTDGRSRKAQEIRRTPRISLVFQRDVEDAFVKLSGTARLQEDRDEVRQRWKIAYNRYFPTDTDRANALFVDVRVESMDLWIRDVTPEPFGLQAATLERDDSDQWRPALPAPPVMSPPPR